VSDKPSPPESKPMPPPAPPPRPDPRLITHLERGSEPTVTKSAPPKPRSDSAR
jgi:hypothetical protein